MEVLENSIEDDPKTEPEEEVITEPIQDSIKPIIVNARFRYEALVKSADALIQNFDADTEFVILIYGHKPEKQENN